mgnify:CR=1 FL=1
MQDYKTEYQRWLNSSAIDEKTRAELLSVKDNEKEQEDRFYTELEFGTAGLRGILGAGTNRMNVYVVRRATAGLAAVISKISPALAARSEWEAPTRPGVFDFEIVGDAALRAFLLGYTPRLQAVFTTDFTRRLWVLERPGARIELVLDRGSVVAGAGRREEAICEVELELLAGDSTDALFDLAIELSADFHLHPEVRSKAERGYALCDTTQRLLPFKAQASTLAAEMTPVEAFRAIALACVLAWDMSGLDMPMAHWFGSSQGFVLQNDWFMVNIAHEGVRKLAWGVVLGLSLMIWWPKGWMRNIPVARRKQLVIGAFIALIVVTLMKRISGGPPMRPSRRRLRSAWYSAAPPMRATKLINRGVFRPCHSARLKAGSWPPTTGSAAASRKRPIDQAGSTPTTRQASTKSSTGTRIQWGGSCGA